MAKTFDAILFDLDGTLIDTTEAILSSLRHTMNHFTGTTPDLPVFQKTMGVPLLEVLEGLLPGRAKEAAEVYVTHSLKIHKDLVKPYPGVIKTLETLRSSGTNLALVTSKRRRSAEIGLKQCGLDVFFKAVVCYEDTAQHKPHPAPLFAALDAAVIERGRVLMVGDTVFDVRAAKNADGARPGLRVESCAVTYGTGQKEALATEDPDYLLDAFGDILPIVDAGIRNC